MTPNVDVIIKGRRLILKPLSENEINERYLSWLNDPEVNRFLRVREKKQTIADIHNYIRRIRSKKDCEIFAIFTRKNKVHIGNIAITQYDVHQGVSFYSTMIGDYKAIQLGMGGEAMCLFIDFLFYSPAIRRVEAGVIAKNEKSWKTLEMLGFKREGVLRKSSVLSSGEVSDNYVYGLLREEWAQQRERLDFILQDIEIIDNRSER